MVDDSGYVDINVFVYWLGDHPAFGKTAHGWIRKIEEATRGRYVTSGLAVYECVVILAGLTGRNLKEESFIEAVVNAITGLKGLRIEEMKSEDVIQSVHLMKEHEIDYEDALHLATALRVGAKEILSNDRDFERTPLRRVL